MKTKSMKVIDNKLYMGAYSLEELGKKYGTPLYVYDIVYNPVKTNLIMTAREMGYKTVTGVDMFIYQAQNQNKHNHPVLGINTDTIGYNKYIGINNDYYGSLPQYPIEVAIYDNSAEAITIFYQRRKKYFDFSKINLNNSIYIYDGSKLPYISVICSPLNLFIPSFVFIT